MAFRWFACLAFFVLLSVSCKGAAGLSVQDAEILLPPDSNNDQRRQPEYYYLKLPEDTSTDTSRSLQNFSFANFLETDLNLDLKLYDVRGLTDKQLAEYQRRGAQHELVSHESVNATIVVKSNREKRPIFVGKSDAQGKLRAKLMLQPAFDNCTLEIIRPQAAKKSYQIERVTEFSSVSRTISLVETNATAESEIYADSDGDFIPDVYDAFPNDALRAFQYDVPVIRFLTVAFEDNFPALGDGDFNDFIARYFVTKITNAENRIIEIQGVAEAVARVAGYDHRFGIIINFPGNTAQVALEYKNHMGMTTSSTVYSAVDKANLVVFERTKQAFTRLNGGSGVDNGYNDRPRSNGHSTSFKLTFAIPADPASVDEAPFDPYIFVHNTGYDIHLMGKPALTNTNNPQGSSFRDANGYPRALLVPVDWAHPIEATFIENAYPHFLPWRTSFGMTDTDWYLTRIDSLVVLQDFFAASQIRNEYLGQAMLGSDALIVDIKTNGEIRYLSSAAPQYVYNGSYTYNAVARELHIDFTTVDQINPNCIVTPCDVIQSFPAASFSINPALRDVKINGVVDNTLSATLTQTNTPLSFTRRQGFGPYDE